MGQYKEYEDMRNKKKQAEQRRKDRKLKKYLAEEKSLLDGKIENKKFQLVVPESGAEIRREGRLLGHCVGSYTDRVLSGQCQIYFIRKKRGTRKALLYGGMEKRADCPMQRQEELRI